MSMARNHLFTAKLWQDPRVRRVRHALSLGRMFRQISASQRRLPDYIIVGAQKSGTTSLWAYLNEHPLISPALTKEMHYFDNNYYRGTAWYRMHFPLKTMDDERKSTSRETLTGESSAYYMFHPLAPQRVANLIPQIKLIFLLRNPVDRAFSHYQLKLRRRQESLTFEDAIAAEADRLMGEEQKIVRSPCYYSPAHDRFSYLARGRYLDQLKRWQQLFPPEQILILESEELFKRTADTYQRVLGFLNVRCWQPPEFGNRFPGKYHDKMSDATRRKLVAYFAPFNEELYQHLNVQFAWDR
jgi:hypothetical protein